MAKTLRTSSTLFRARVNTTRMKKAERIFNQLGLKTGDAVNLFFAQVIIHNDLPFRITTQPERLQSDEEQAMLWDKTLGEY
jgi:addiction module RelB/DinJ family antitoxin